MTTANGLVRDMLTITGNRLARFGEGQAFVRVRAAVCGWALSAAMTIADAGRAKVKLAVRGLHQEVGGSLRVTVGHEGASMQKAAEGESKAPGCVRG